MYSKKIVDRFRNPKFAGEMKDADAVGQAGNMKCGDVMKIYLKVNKEGVVTDAKFQTFGCIAAIAASDAMCELIKGKKIEDVKKITYDDIIEQMGGDIPKIKVHCSVLGTRALKDAIKNYEKVA